MTRMMNAAFLAILLCTTAPAARAEAPPPPPATIDLTIVEHVTAAPDKADISVGVSTRAMTAKDALEKNAAEMNNVFTALQKAGIEKKYIQTEGLSLYPQFDYSQNNETPRVTGYQASNTVNVTVHDLKNLGATLDSLVAAGVNQINGPSFGVTEHDQYLDKARAAAVKKARNRADIYATAAGAKAGRLLSISESTFAAGPPPAIPMMRSAMAADMAAPTPVSPGEVGMTVTVQLRFELLTAQ
jgi:uncharacterized protein